MLAAPKHPVLPAKHGRDARPDDAENRAISGEHPSKRPRLSLAAAEAIEQPRQPPHTLTAAGPLQNLPPQFAPLSQAPALPHYLAEAPNLHHHLADANPVAHYLSDAAPVAHHLADAHGLHHFLADASPLRAQPESKAQVNKQKVKAKPKTNKKASKKARKSRKRV